MTFLQKALIFPLISGAVMARNEDSWLQPRDISRFQFLMDRSPFSLPTAEETSPLADRYTLTGAASLNGDPMVFVLDKTTQEHHMISKSSSKPDMGLVEYLPDPDPRRMRATIKVNGQTATISYSEPATVQGQQPQNAAMATTNPNPSAGVNPPPGQAVVPGAPPNMQKQGTQPPQRHVIRRRIISGQPATGP